MVVVLTPWIALKSMSTYFQSGPYKYKNKMINGKINGYIHTQKIKI